MKSVILSYDYELFFGDQSGTVLKTLIEPTNLLMKFMEEVGYRGNFFVDWQMLKYLKLINTERTLSDYLLIEEQLKEMVRRGHRIELHIHPHWVDAKYNGDGTWDFSDFTHYSLNSFTEIEIIRMFEEGTALLTAIARQVEPDYKICAFRAGGWAVQPFNVLKKAFSKTGIIIDSSVMPGSYAQEEGSYYDFRQAPNPKSGYYYFVDDVCVESDIKSFIEVPISSMKIDIPYRILRRLYMILVKRIHRIADGTHFRKNALSYSGIARSTNVGVLTLSGVNPWCIRFNQWRCKSEICCYIDHPKDFTNNTKDAIYTLSKICKQSLLYCELLGV